MCSMQTIIDVLSGNKSKDIDEKLYLKIKDSYKLCLKLIWIEEKFNIVKDNYYEWEEEIQKSYDFLISVQNSDSNCNQVIKNHGIAEIVTLNRRIINVLNSIRMYRDQVLHDLSGINPDYKVRFEKKTNELYDSSYAYQLLELLRNYTQHQGLFIDRITVHIPFNKRINKELWYFVDSNFENLKKIDKYHAKIKIKPDVDDKCKWINLVGVVREYIDKYVILHEEFRKITQEDYVRALNIVEDEIPKLLGDFLPKIAFYGKEDFLFQKEYLDKLTEIRSKKVLVDSSKFYIEKNTFLDSDKIRVSNAVKCTFIYNS